MNKPVIVSGEASETDSEDDNSICATGLLITNQIKGQAVSGEDSESDNENDDASAVSRLAGSNKLDENGKNDRNASLLHQKLRETNIRFYNNLENLIKNVVGESEKSLTEVDQQILKSQLVVQGAATSLKNLNLQANTLKNKLNTLLSSNFLANVRVSE